MRTLFIALILASAPALAENKGMAPPNLSKEERQARAEKHEKIAAHHKKMAECLRSSKPLSDCHKELREACEKDPGSCPMMDKHGQKHDSK